VNARAVDEYKSVRESLSKLVARAAEINVVRPMRAYGKIRELSNEARALRSRAEQIVLSYEETMDAQSIQTMRDVMATMPVLMTVTHRVNSLRILSLESSSVLDQKAAFALAFFALYVSIVSVVLSFVFALL
jgi:hypothetical protein